MEVAGLSRPPRGEGHGSIHAKPRSRFTYQIATVFSFTEETFYKGGMLKVHTLPPSKSSSAWQREAQVAQARHATKTFEEADLILHVALPVPHFPSFLWECRNWPGGQAAFLQARYQQMGELWHQVIPAYLQRLSASQQLLIFDLESNISPCVRHGLQLKAQISDERISHVSLCHEKGTTYRPGVDISFPAALPTAFGDESMRAVPSARRPILLSFQGCGRNMPLRNAIFALHNGSDRVCLDAAIPRARIQDAVQAKSGVRVPPNARDEPYVALHAASRFALCPRGDAVYSFRMVEALSCGAIPVVYGDGWVLPFSELLDYSTFTVCIAEADVQRTASILSALGEAHIAELQRHGRDVFARYFVTVAAQLDAVLEIMVLRRARRARGEDDQQHQVCDELAREVVAGARALDSRRPSLAANHLPTANGRRLEVRQAVSREAKVPLEALHAACVCTCGLRCEWRERRRETS